MFEQYSTIDIEDYVEYIAGASLRNRILHDIIAVRQLCGRNHNPVASSSHTPPVLQEISINTGVRSDENKRTVNRISTCDRRDRRDRSEVTGDNRGDFRSLIRGRGLRREQTESRQNNGENVSGYDSFIRDATVENRESRIINNRNTKYKSCASCKKITDELWEKTARHLEESSRYAYQGALFIWTEHFSEENSHIHVVHDCRFGNSTCRCSILSGLPIKRRNSRSRTPSEYTKDGWYALTLYLVLRTGIGRRCVVYLANNGCRTLRASRDIRCSKDGTVAGEATMDFTDSAVQFCSYSGQQNIKRFRRENYDDTSQKGGPQKKSFGKRNSTAQEVLEFLWQHLVVPIEHCMLLPQWIEHDNLAFINAQNEEFKLGIDIYKRKILNMSIIELYNHYKDKPLYFNETTGNLHRLYHNIDVSLQYLDKFLSFQFQQNDDAKLEFMSTLYNTLAKRNGKKNTIWLYGPPDCGKSYFVESIRGLMITSGSTSIMNRTNNFPFNTLINVRLGILDELSYDPAIYTDPLKMLLGGNTIHVSKKYADDLPIHKTPIIIMSNTECLPNIEAFRSRLSRYVWCKCTDNTITPMFEKLLHPFSIIKLFEMYSIIKLHNIDENV